MSGRAAKWLLESGIQEPGGGVARYYRTDVQRNQPVSTEITGYGVSAFLYLHQPAAALKAAEFLLKAWDGSAMAFELESAPDDRFTYFFDCGIIVRGLLGAWRYTGSPELLDVAAAIGKSMACDFADGGDDYHPILTLPQKQPVPRDPLRWSRTTGCYQVKAALAWQELFEATGETLFEQCYGQAVEAGLRDYTSFLPGHSERAKVVDRLHAFLYFLEGLLPRAQDPACADALRNGIAAVEHLLKDTAAEFERSDVYAQLLRIRIFADWAGAVPLDRQAAEQEAAALARFQAHHDDPRIDGGFYFGRAAGVWLPFINPVSTAFAVQALGLWSRYSGGGSPQCWHLLI